MATPQKTIRVPDDEWAAWAERAKHEGLSVSEWIRQLCDLALRSANFTLTVTDNTHGAEVVVPSQGNVVQKRGGYQPVAAGPPPTKPPPSPFKPAKPTRLGGRKRTEMCIHRRRPDEFCSRCD